MLNIKEIHKQKKVFVFKIKLSMEIIKICHMRTREC
jgi:hypothetical protein